MGAPKVFLNWTCPDCGYVHRDEQDPVYGPFITLTCSDCGHVFGLDAVIDSITEEPMP